MQVGPKPARRQCGTMMLEHEERLLSSHRLCETQASILQRSDRFPPFPIQSGQKVLQITEAEVGRCGQGAADCAGFIVGLFANVREL